MAEPMQSELEKRLANASALAAKLQTDVFWYNGPIERAGYNAARRALADRRHDAVLVYLTTNGGDANAAYQIARAIQRAYQRFTLYVQTTCKSAGTLIAVGANELVMPDDAELGPLDAQVQKTQEIGEVQSGLDVAQAIDFLTEKSLQAFRYYLLDVRLGAGVSTKLAAEMAANLTVGLFSPIFAQIDPLRAAELSRALAIAQEYGQRLAGSRISDSMVQHLVCGYPSHSFVIDRDEATKYFPSVRAPNEEETEIGAWLPRRELDSSAPVAIILTNGAEDDHARQPGTADADHLGNAGDARPEQADQTTGGGGVAVAGSPAGANPGHSNPEDTPPKSRRAAGKHQVQSS